MDSNCEFIEKWSATAIRSEMSDSANAICNAIIIHDEIHSTNRWMMDEITAGRLCKGDICIAESQTNGRGRFGRKWQSPGNSGLYASLLWSEKNGEFSEKNASLLTLAMGVAVANALKGIGISEIEIKWPNDILMYEKKISGILVERVVKNAVTYWVVGIGLNIGGGIPVVDSSAVMPGSLSECYPASLEKRNYIASKIFCSVFESCFDLFMRGGESVVQSWGGYDYLNGKQIVIKNADGTVLRGMAGGVFDDGSLRVFHDGGVARYYSGETSVRIQ